MGLLTKLGFDSAEEGEDEDTREECRESIDARSESPRVGTGREERIDGRLVTGISSESESP